LLLASALEREVSTTHPATRAEARKWTLYFPAVVLWCGAHAVAPERWRDAEVLHAPPEAASVDCYPSIALAPLQMYAPKPRIRDPAGPTTYIASAVSFRIRQTRTILVTSLSLLLSARGYKSVSFSLATSLTSTHNFRTALS
jgi:hypothetical protein